MRPTPVVPLSAEQRAELERLRDHSPRPHLRERAAAVLKVAGGLTLKAVAAGGLLRPRDPETVAAWVRRYAAAGAAGLGVRPGRGRKPAFSPRGADR
jgi:hypothetical protein